MSDVLADLVREVKATREKVAQEDAARTAAFDELKAEVAKGSTSVGEVEAKIGRIATDQSGTITKLQELEETINVISKKVNRPGRDHECSDDANRKAAIGLLQLKHQFKVPKVDADHPFSVTEDQVAEAMVACKALRNLMHCTDVAHLPDIERKALSSFSLGSNGFILAPEMSSTVLSCLIDQTDVTGLMSNMAISGPSVKFLVDNVLLDIAAWACDTSCFANNPGTHFSGLGELEIKPETLRYIVCASRDILEDASINIESWMLGKVNRAFRATISNAIISGDGVGKPLGILNGSSGIPACNTSANTPAGQFTWQDLVMLRWQVPMQWQGGGKYLMNQNTLGLTLSMSDGMNRPLMIASPVDAGSFLTGGSAVQVVTQMPDVAPGSTPIAYGNWNAVYMIVNRKSVAMQQDPYSAGFCVLYKFEARVGGSIICPLAARLLRIQ